MSTLIVGSQPERNYGSLGGQVNSVGSSWQLNQFQIFSDAPLSKSSLAVSLSGLVANEIDGVQGIPGPSGSGIFMTEKARQQYDPQLFRSSYRDAQQRFHVAQNRLEAVGNGNQVEITRFERFFGTYSDERFDAIKAHFNRAGQVFAGTITIDYADFGDRPSFTAWAGQSKLLASGEIGEKGVTGDGLGLDLLHEVMHIQAPTTDKAYDIRGVEALADKEPEEAINNAHSLAHYAFSL